MRGAVPVDGSVVTTGSATSSLSNPTTSTVAAVPPFAGATSVRAFGANGGGQTDDTAAFGAAMNAALASTKRYTPGPSGNPQAVVRVPPGVYRIFQLVFSANIRLEVDAGAVLEQAGRKSLGESQRHGGPALIVWDGPAGNPLRNVSIVGVGSRSTALKRAAGPIEPGWDLDTSFTFDLDTQRTGGDNFNSAMQLANVDGFLVENVFTIQNGTRTGQLPLPTSSRAALMFAPRNDSGVDGPFYDPHNGAIRGQYNTGGPYGYGATQVTSGHNLTFSYIYSRGGTALRLETDFNLRKSFGAEIRGLSATRVVGVDCNRAVSFSPHAQRNSDVHVSNVIARNCHQGVIQSADESLPSDARGRFDTSTMSGVLVVGGPGAQIPVPGRLGLWTSGTSTQAFARDAGADWSVRATRLSCRGSFTEASDKILLDGSTQRIVCAT